MITMNLPSKITKVLDKYSDTVYNSEEELIHKRNDISLDKRENPVRRLITAPRNFDPRYFQTLLNSKASFEDAWEKTKKYFPTETHAPVYAGGFFRDFYFKQWPNDLDLFVNTHGIPEDEVEDTLSLFCYFSGKKFSQTLYADQYANLVNPPDLKNFFVFNIHTDDQDICPTQVIGRDLGPNVTSPLDFTKDFDYGLVMQAVPLDGRRGEFSLHSSQLTQASFGEKKLYVTQKGGQARFYSRVYSKEVRSWPIATLYKPEHNNNEKKRHYDYIKENQPSLSIRALRQF